MKCRGCGSDHVNLDETWTKRGSLTKGGYNPFRQGIYEGFQSGTYCSSCMANNNSRAACSWTTEANVTPRNQLWKQIIIKDVPNSYAKENYVQTGLTHQRKPGNFLSINQTWSNQKKYTSG
jgi:hypothetical protein